MIKWWSPLEVCGRNLVRGTSMIVRIFRVRVLPGRLSDWKNKVEGISIPWLRQQEGLIAFYPGKPIDPQDREFWMISIWKDVESIKKVAGPEWQQPILLEDEADLVETVEIHHFEIFGNKHTPSS